MKKFILLLILAVSFGVISNASNANALLIGDAYYVGLVNDGAPANPTNEVDYINYLITLAIGAGPTVYDGETYDRINSTLNIVFPDADITGAVKQNNNNTTFIANGAHYILAKYDGLNYGSAVWYSADGFGEVTLPSVAGTGNWGLSHTSAYNPSEVPEPTTMLLFGTGLIGLSGFVRRKKK